MTFRSSSTPARIQRAALALAALGILTGGGCIASGPLAGGTSLSELASAKTKRPVVTASYGDSASLAPSKSGQDDPAIGRNATPSPDSTAARAGGAASPPNATPAEGSPAEGSLGDDRFAEALAQLPPKEAAALRQMLSAIREGAAARPAGISPPVSEPVPYIVADAAGSNQPDPALSSRRHPGESATDPGEYVPSELITPTVANRPVSPFVADSLAAFTAPSASPVAPSPLARIFGASTPPPAGGPTKQIPNGSASVGSVAQAGAISEIVSSGNSGSSSIAVEPGPSEKDPPAPDWHAKLAEATRALSVAIDKPGAPETERKALEAKLRLLQAIEHRFAESLVPIDGSPEEQAFWKELCAALQELFDPQATPYDDKRATLALRRLDEATRQLSRSADLDVARLAFCTAVERFGQYDEFPEYVFSADQEALLYVEVRRFAAQTVEQPYPGYRTALEGSYRIVEVGGGKRWADHIFPVAEEVSRSPRSDFFIAYRVYLPKNLPAGKYRLEFNLHDQVGDKHGSGWLDFAVKSGR
ncbi:MAG TPA: hypothetical protein VGN57_07220 [Pirellulaceae bacterium]|jgi:hypothetical protein|nr:hypothetical protein [Pirellulaceae bacterium]